jgi:hypothetical protein
MAQTVERLPSKCEALSSNHSTAKKVTSAQEIVLQVKKKPDLDTGLRRA